jgi:hypothetical protein
MTATATRTLCCGDVAVVWASRCRLVVLKTTIFKGLCNSKACLDMHQAPEMVIFEHCLDLCLATIAYLYELSALLPRYRVCAYKVVKLNVLQLIVAVSFAVCRNFADSQTVNDLNHFYD